MVRTRSQSQGSHGDGEESDGVGSAQYDDEDYQVCDPAELNAFVFDPRTLAALAKSLGPLILKADEAKPQDGQQNYEDLEARLQALENREVPANPAPADTTPITTVTKGTINALKQRIVTLEGKVESAAKVESGNQMNQRKRGRDEETFFQTLTDKLMKANDKEEGSELRKALIELHPALSKLPKKLVHHHPYCYKEPGCWLLMWETETRAKFFVAGSQIPGPAAQAFHQLFECWIAESGCKEKVEILRKTKESFRRLCLAFYDSANSKAPMDFLFDIRDELDVAYQLCADIEAAGLTQNVGADAAKRFRTNMALRGSTSSLTMGAAMAKIYGGAKN